MLSQSDAVLTSSSLI